MNIFPKEFIIVVDMADDIIKLKVAGENEKNKVKSIGFSEEKDIMKLEVNNVSEKIEVINTLISEGALFLYGHGWYPSELLEHYKEQGFKFKEYKIISWSTPDKYLIEER